MLWNRYVIGYHGCDAELARRIVCREETLRFSANDYDWLGSGIYFWEGSAERARQWAESAAMKENSHVKIPGVVGAVIDLGECLNLIESENLVIVQKAYNRLVDLLELGEIPLPLNSGKDLKLRRLDRAVFEGLHNSRENKNLPPLDTIRAFFVEGEPLYPTAGIRHMDHIQICVRDPKRIIGCFLP